MRRASRTVKRRARVVEGALTRREGVMGMRSELWVVVSVALAACSGGGRGDGGTRRGGGGTPVVVPAGAAAGATTAGGGCAVGQSLPCTCTDGSNGTSSCQLDGTFSVCQCTGSNAAGVMAGQPGAGGAGSSAPLTAGAGSDQVTDTQAAADSSTGAVILPPQDIAACTGQGAPPGPNEQVEVLEIKTDVVTYGGKEYPVTPGGFAAPGGTYYGCFWVDIDMPDKHHIIGWEGAVNGNRAIHHQQVSIGERPFYLSQQGGLCGLPTVDYTWTGERPTEWTPAQAGYPIGGPANGGKAHFLWQVHFEDVTNYTGGFKAYITTNLRKYDAGNFEQGDVSGILVPAMSAATHVADCTPDMTTQKLVQPIYVYAAMQHAHLTITHLKSELKRNGQTIFVFGDQDVAGFLGFFDQSFKPYTPCVEILPGDELITTCDYNNTFPFDVVGGEATNQEMCTTFMQYYPRLPGTSNNFCGTIDSTGGFTGG